MVDFLMRNSYRILFYSHASISQRMLLTIEIGINQTKANVQKIYYPLLLSCFYRICFNYWVEVLSGYLFYGLCLDFFWFAFWNVVVFFKLFALKLEIYWFRFLILQQMNNTDRQSVSKWWNTMYAYIRPSSKVSSVI